MKFKLWREYGALNSPPVFNALERGLRKLGFSVVDRDQDIDVIWSVLWAGRMKPNQAIYDHAVSQKKPIMIIEVGNLHRGLTWRISLNHIHGIGKFGNLENLDNDRPKKLSIHLKKINTKRKDSILIACQHENSLQWKYNKSMKEWALGTFHKIREYSQRPVIVRPHPRSMFSINSKEIVFSYPNKVKNSYDDFDIDYNHHCVINFNSGPAVRAAIEGTPIICDQTSLAFPVSEIWENLESASLPDREEWFLQLCHSEWTVNEIEEGIPILRLLPDLEILLKT